MNLAISRNGMEEKGNQGGRQSWRQKAGLGVEGGWERSAKLSDRRLETWVRSEDLVDAKARGRVRASSSDSDETVILAHIFISAISRCVNFSCSILSLAFPVFSHFLCPCLHVPHPSSSPPA